MPNSNPMFNRPAPAEPVRASGWAPAALGVVIGWCSAGGLGLLLGGQVWGGIGLFAAAGLGGRCLLKTWFRHPASPREEPTAERLERVLETSQDCMWEYDAATRQFDCSEHCRGMLAPPRAGYSSLHGFLRGLDREQRRRLLRALRAVWNETGPMDELVHITSAASTKRWLRVRARVASGRRYVTGLVSDVTEEVELSSERSFYQSFMESVVDAMPLPMSVKNDDGVFVLVNRAFCKKMNLAPGDVLGRRANSVVDGGVVERLEEQDRLVLETGVSHSIEDWFELTRLQRKAFLRVTKNRCIDKRGRPVVVTTYEDQSELRDYARRMGQLSVDVEAFVQRLLCTLPHPIYVKDAESRYLMANPAIAEQWGLCVDDMIGVSSRQLFGDERGLDIEEEDKRILAGEVISKEDCIPDRKTGALRYWHVTKIACPYVDGRNVIIGANFEITRLRRTEMELREALQRQTRLRLFLQQLFDALPHPLFVKDRQHRYVMTNRAHAAFHRSVPGRIIGTTSREHAAREVAEAVEREEDDLFNAQEPDRVIESEHVIHDPEGAPHPTLIRKLACEDADGEPVVIGVTFDVTEARAKEVALTERLQRQTKEGEFLRAVFDALPLMIYVKDAQLSYRIVNPAWGEFLGVPAAQLVGRSLREFVTTAQADAQDALDRQLLAGNSADSLSLEMCLRDAHGTEHDLVWHRRLARDPDGNTVIIGFNQDVSALREAAEVRQRLDMLVRNVPLGITLLNPAGRFLQVNPCLLDLLGRDESELLCLRYQDLVPTRHQSLLRAKLAEIRRRGVLQPFELSLIHQSGREIPALLGGVFVARGREEDALWLFVADLSERKAVEAELLRHRDQLRELVLEQTAGLVQAKEAAERANGAKSEFVTSLSQELRTPMHTILSFARLGMERGEQLAPDKVCDYFRRVLDGGERLLRRLDELLDLANLESGRVLLDMQAVDVPAMLDELVGEFEALFAANNLTLRRIDSARLPPVRMDRERIRQVLRNLLSNAVKFAPPGSRVSVQSNLVGADPARRADDPSCREMLEIAVADEGPGIPAAEIGHLFDRFVQARGVAGGSGPGLAICREIVLAHGGQIVARNRVGGGSVFVLRLPVQDRAAQCATESYED